MAQRESLAPSPRPSPQRGEGVRRNPWGPKRLASELLHPGPQFDLPAPGAARLLQDVPIILRDGGRRALAMPPSMTKCATWMPCGDSSRARLCASPRKANLPMAKDADCG